MLGLLLLFSVVYGCYLTIKTLVYGIEVPGYTSIVVLMLLINGFIMIVLGIMGEYIARIFIEVKNRPLFVISHKLGFD